MLNSAYDPIFDSAAQEWDVDPTLLRALASQESSGNPRAVSKKGAKGLTGLMDDTAAGLGVTDPFDPAQAIYGGAKYLREALDKEGNPDDALRYYHGGPNWRNAYGPESKAYVPAVAAHYQKLASAKGATKTDAVPSDDEFLKATTGAPAQAKPDAAIPDDEFLKVTGASPEAPKSQPPASDEPTVATGGEMMLPGGEPPPAQTPRPLASEAGGALSRIGGAAVQGAKEGIGDNPRSFGPETDAALRRIGIYPPAPGQGSLVQNFNEGLFGTVASGVNLAGGALRGVQGMIAQTGRELPRPPAVPGNGYLAESVNALTDPAQAARDIAAYPEANPTGNVLGGTAAMARMAPRAMERNPLTSLPPEIDRPYLSTEFERNPLAPAARDKLEAPQAAQGAPAPNSVGAAASNAQDAAMPKREALAHQAQGETQKLLESQPVGQRDTNAYVPGIAPNAAEIEQDVNTARELKAAGQASPKISQEMREIADRHNEIRKSYFEDTVGSPVQLETLKAERAAQAENDIEAAFKNKKEADATPVVQLAEQIKASPDGKRPLVQNVVNSVLKSLDEDGKLTTDPEQLYGVRKHIDDLIEDRAADGSQRNVRAVSQLTQLKSALDDVIEGAAPGFKQYLANFSEASKKIDEMQALQKIEKRVYDTQGRMTYAGFQRAMRQIVEARQGQGVNPFKSISEETMQRLWNLRDDLRRSASAQELARTPGGSDTAQNLVDIMRGVGKMGGQAAIHGVANAIAPVAGSFVVQGVQSAAKPFIEGRRAAKADARAQKLLHPNTTLRNPLTGN